MENNHRKYKNEGGEDIIPYLKSLAYNSDF